MPIPAAAVIGAAAIQAGSSIASSMAQSSMNKATRQWNEAMYARQREDALADWNRQNDYNSPANQMARFKAAGLNPNLIYGQSNEAPAVRSTDVKSWSPAAPDYSGIGNAAVGAIGSYMDMTMRDEQLKNMDAQRTNMQLDAALKTAEIAGKNLSNAKNAALFDTSLQTANELLRSLQTGTDIKINKEVRDAALHAPNLAAAFNRVANIAANTDKARAEVANLQRSGVLQGMEIDLRKLGMSWNDPIWLRMLSKFADGQPLDQVVKGLWDNIKSAVGDYRPSILPKSAPGSRYKSWEQEYNRAPDSVRRVLDKYRR